MLSYRDSNIKGYSIRMIVRQISLNLQYTMQKLILSRKKEENVKLLLLCGEINQILTENLWKYEGGNIEDTEFDIMIPLSLIVPLTESQRLTPENHSKILLVTDFKLRSHYSNSQGTWPIHLMGASVIE